MCWAHEFFFSFHYRQIENTDWKWNVNHERPEICSVAHQFLYCVRKKKCFQFNCFEFSLAVVVVIVGVVVVAVCVWRCCIWALLYSNLLARCVSVCEHGYCHHYETPIHRNDLLASWKINSIRFSLVLNSSHMHTDTQRTYKPLELNCIQEESYTIKNKKKPTVHYTTYTLLQSDILFFSQINIFIWKRRQQKNVDNKIYKKSMNKNIDFTLFEVLRYLGR